jgi:two-component system, NarL family, invasion response regulator UvrY
MLNSTNGNEKTKISLADDHVLLRNGLASLLKDLGFDVVFEADNGLDFMDKLKMNLLPDIVLMDINMPQMDGYQTTQWLKKQYPDIKVIALSMYDDDNAIIRMLRCGAKGYILKDSDPSEVKSALHSVQQKGYYHSELVTSKLIHSLNQLDEPEKSFNNLPDLNDREMEFLKFVCTELTYKEIAEQMNLSPRTIDGYRDSLFEKLNVKSRVGLAVFAIKNRVFLL